MNPQNDMQWTRLIDGELSYSEQQEFLETIEETPDGWKRLALGLLESEAIRRDLRAWQSDRATIVVSQPPSHQRGLQRVMYAVLALGCLCLGIGMEHLRGQATRMAEMSRRVPTTAPEELPDKPELQQTLNLVLSDAAGRGRSVEVPVIDSQGVDSVDLLRQSAIPNDWRKELEDQGYVIYEERKYISVTLTDGREGIAPVSDVVVEYHPTEFQ